MIPCVNLNPSSHTTYVSVVDENRMAVSIINSVFHDFGAGLTTPETGILLHNRASGFTLEEDHPNTLAPGKRPMHTLLPGMMMKDGKVTMSFGVMGGPYQACGHVRLLTNMLDYGMDMQSAIDAPPCFLEWAFCKRFFYPCS